MYIRMPIYNHCSDNASWEIGSVRFFQLFIDFHLKLVLHSVKKKLVFSTTQAVNNQRLATQ